MIHTFDFI